MNYKWISFGEDYNPVIAFIAPSNGIEGEAGQKLIAQKIAALIGKGFCVKIPQYENGALVIEPEIVRISSERLKPTVFPAISDTTGANQVIDCIKNGWNMMPWMGGDSFENKIPLIVKHFENHPEDRNPEVKIFGLSNSTYATVLASRGICSFISTPFLSVFDRAKSDAERFSNQAQELEKLLKGQTTTTYSRRVIYNPDNRLSALTQTFHYPMNFGNIVSEINKSHRVEKILEDPRNTKTKEELTQEENLRSLKIPSNQVWSLSIEGFLQIPNRQLICGYGNCLKEFLKQTENNLPVFIEIGNIATRLDGGNGYENLQHDENSGEILVNEYNVEKIYAKKEKLVTSLKALFKQKSELESLPEQEKPAAEQQLRLLSLMPQEIFQKIDSADFNKEDVETILRAQNLVQLEIMKDIKAATKKHKIPLIQNTKNGHCANMSIVNGGNNQVELKEDQIFLTMTQQIRGYIEILSGESLIERNILNRNPKY